MNEELQSANEELETTNDELRSRTFELDRLNLYLESILTNLQIGVVVLDNALNVHIWNTYIEDLWGLRADEVVGKNFMALDIGLPVAELRQPLLACLHGEVDNHEVTVRATNRRGQAMQCKLTLAALRSLHHSIEGVTVLMEALPANSRRRRAATVVETGEGVE